ncbi:MAG: class I SAM-dependent methyltransferase [Ardenticatenaceae bacterium]|nr:class I SAM-dependent methyltransferase [Ardenticatenaceae bacterium]
MISKVKRWLRTAVLWFLHLWPPEKVLRFLFGLDTWLYFLEGQIAIAYGQGVHTKHRHMRYHDFFVARINAADRVLDVGCGVGAVAHDVAERSGAQVVGVDINPQNIAAAQERFIHPRVQYVVGDVLAMVPDGRFSVIILSNVLEHLPERPYFLRRLCQNTNPERLLIRVPLFERDWRVPLKRELGVEWRLDPTHETEYTIESFAQEMTEAHLRITYREICWGEIWAEVMPLEEDAS